MRSFWTGEIAFGLVTIPIKLYTATRDLTPQFRLLHKECGTPIVTVRRCPKHRRDLTWDEIGKGYAVGAGEFALFTKEELAKLEGDDTRGTIEIVEFVDPAEVDFAYLENSYWAGPGGRNVHGFQLLRASLEEAQKVAIARVRLRTRMRMALLRPRGRVFGLDMMRYPEELLPADEIAPADGKAAPPKEMRLALHLIHELTGAFDPARHPNEYRSAVLEAVEAKVESGHVARPEKGAAAEAPSAARGAKVIDLASLLSTSLKAAAKTRPAKRRSSKTVRTAARRGIGAHAPTRTKRAAG